jgi:hypothetical protein
LTVRPRVFASGDGTSDIFLPGTNAQVAPLLHATPRSNRRVLGGVAIQKTETSTMRSFAIALAVLAPLALAGTGNAAPPTPAIESSGLTQLVQWREESRYCRRLRRACEYKDERGERGEGNCRRYREECGGTSYCERLRRACVYKEYRGEVGEGNCRRYRSECGGY